jgi:trigger factor
VEQPDFREFRNDQIHVLMKEKPGCIVRLEITTSKEAVAAAYEKAHHTVKKQVVLPGFRKGKAPDEVIRNKYRDFVDREARDVLKNLALHEALKLVQREPFSQHAIRKADLKRASMEEGAQLLFEYESHPLVPEIDLSKLQVTFVPPEAVKEEAVEAGFQMLLEQAATFTPIDERALEIGDYAVVDIDVIDEPAHNLVADRRVYCRQGYTADWLLNALVGMRVGDVKEAEAQEEIKRGASAEQKTRSCRITLKKLLNGELPQETPENLEKLNCKNFIELKERVRKRYETNAEEAAQEEMRKQLKNELIRHFAFDLPQSLVQAETQARINCWGSHAKDQAAHPGQAEVSEEFKKEVLEEVKRYFTLMYLLRKKGMQLPLEISQKDIMSEMTHQLIYTPFEKRIVINDDVESTRHRIYMNVMMLKVENWILDRLQGKKTLLEHQDEEQHHVCSESCTHHHH